MGRSTHTQLRYERLERKEGDVIRWQDPEDTYIHSTYIPRNTRRSQFAHIVSLKADPEKKTE